jgi:hypothetical protein
MSIFYKVKVNLSKETITQLFWQIYCLPTLSKFYKQSFSIGKESITPLQNLAIHCCKAKFFASPFGHLFKVNLCKESLTLCQTLSICFKLSLSTSKESLTRLQTLSIQCCKATLSILLCLYLLLVAQGVERNPGPVTNNVSQDKIVSISSYNVQGLSIASHKGMPSRNTPNRYELSKKSLAI